MACFLENSHLQSAYILKSKHLFCKHLKGIMVTYANYNMCKNHENTLKFEGAGTIYFKVPDMMASGNILRV